MRSYGSKTKNFFYFLYRLARPVLDPIKFGSGIFGYGWFFRDVYKYKRQDKGAKIFTGDLYPVLDERVGSTPFDAQYFYQQIWCFDQIRKNIPTKEHVDIGSSYGLCGYISLLVKTVFVDLRPISAQLDNLSIVKGSILNLPFPDHSLQSVSCLHVVEHIGLGRYGDVIDPKGAELACGELARVLAPGGRLYFSAPIGRARLCFNAHRVLDPETVIRYFNGLELVSFSAVDDRGRFHLCADHQDYRQADYSCGLFIFTKKLNS